MDYGSGKIVEERVKEEILMNRLRQYMDSDAATTDFDIPNDPWKQEWSQMVAQLKEPGCYV